MPNFKRMIALALTNSILCGTRTWSFSMKRNLLNWAGYKIGENTKIVGPIFITASLCVGKDTWIGRNFSVNGNGSVEIGDNCDIAPDVSFYTGGHEIGDENRRAGKGINKKIIVKNSCWICAASKLLPGAVIEESCVVAAGAVVTKHIEKNQLVGGVPARTIKRLDDEEKREDC